MSYIFQHTTFGWCPFDLLSLVILAGVSIYFSVKIAKMKTYVRDLEDCFSNNQFSTEDVTEQTEK